MGERMEEKALEDRVCYEGNDRECNPLELRNNWNR